jgi:ferric-dicitrate binding protein FerR (iron transport regulator)
MNTTRLPALIFVLLVGCLPPVALSALTGQVMYTEGDVTIRNGSQTRDAALGDTLGPGDIIATAAQSLAVIDLANATTLKLREKTSLAIDSIGETTSVTLNAGGVFTSIAKKLTGQFSMRTQSAVAGVRGTEFFMAYGRTIDALPDVWLCVNSGAVEVALPETGQTMVVKEGLGINIVGGKKLTTPRRYPWTRRLNWNMDSASGKVEDTTDLEQAYSDLLNQDYN